MEEVYLFWNTFNLFIIIALTLSIGLIIGSIISVIINIITQVNDSCLSVFTKASGLIIGFYIMSPFILNSIKEFSINLWKEI